MRCCCSSASVRDGTQCGPPPLSQRPSPPAASRRRMSPARPQRATPCATHPSTSPRLPADRVAGTSRPIPSSSMWPAHWSPPRLCRRPDRYGSCPMGGTSPRVPPNVSPDRGLSWSSAVSSCHSLAEWAGGRMSASQVRSLGGWQRQTLPVSHCRSLTTAGRHGGCRAPELQVYLGRRLRTPGRGHSASYSSSCLRSCILPPWWASRCRTQPRGPARARRRGRNGGAPT